MPKQNFQRPVRVPAQRTFSVKPGAPGHPDYGRKTGRQTGGKKTGRIRKR